MATNAITTAATSDDPLQTPLPAKEIGRWEAALHKVGTYGMNREHDEDDDDTDDGDDDDPSSS